MQTTLRLGLIFIAVIALSGLPSSAAETLNYDRQDDYTTAPVSRDYLDLATGLVYHYDATTGTLTPTGTSADLSGFAAFDVAKYGDVMNPATGWVGDCTATICIGEQVALVGSHSVEWRVELYDSTGFNCASIWYTQSAPGAGAILTYSQGQTWIWIYGWCDHGTAEGVLKIDGQPRIYDNTTY